MEREAAHIKSSPIGQHMRGSMRHDTGMLGFTSFTSGVILLNYLSHMLLIFKM